MRYAARQKTQAARPNLELLVAALVDVLAFDHVAHLVLITMHVSRGFQNGAIMRTTRAVPRQKPEAERGRAVPAAGPDQWNRGTSRRDQY
jgi:hypothetical protein